MNLLIDAEFWYMRHRDGFRQLARFVTNSLILIFIALAATFIPFTGFELRRDVFAAIIFLAYLMYLRFFWVRKLVIYELATAYEEAKAQESKQHRSILRILESGVERFVNLVEAVIASSCAIGCLALWMPSYLNPGASFFLMAVTVGVIAWGLWEKLSTDTWRKIAGISIFVNLLAAIVMLFWGDDLWVEAMRPHVESFFGRHPVMIGLLVAMIIGVFLRPTFFPKKGERSDDKKKDEKKKTPVEVVFTTYLPWTLLFVIGGVFFPSPLNTICWFFAATIVIALLIRRDEWADSAGLMVVAIACLAGFLFFYKDRILAFFQ